MAGAPARFLGGLTDFYNTTESWSFDHIWAAYLQAEGVVYPAAVVAAHTIPKVSRTLRCLDFGSGVGDMGHLLGALGHEVHLADVSKTLLARGLLVRDEGQSNQPRRTPAAPARRGLLMR